MKKGNLSWWLERENRKNLGKEKEKIYEKEGGGKLVIELEERKRNFVDL